MENVSLEAVCNYSIIAWVIYHLLTNVIPELKKLRTCIMDLQKMLVYHDLTIRGENPERSGSNQELKKLMTEKEPDDQRQN